MCHLSQYTSSRGTYRYISYNHNYYKSIILSPARGGGLQIRSEEKWAWFWGKDIVDYDQKGCGIVDYDWKGCGIVDHDWKGCGIVDYDWKGCGIVDYD